MLMPRHPRHRAGGAPIVRDEPEATQEDEMRTVWASVAAVPLIVGSIPVFAQDSDADIRAGQTEQQMTDDERFSMITSVIGAIEIIGMPRHPLIPKDVPMSAGYAPGVPRLGIPAQL